MNEIKQFQVNKKYSMTSACDSNCKWVYEVVKRTDKSVWLKSVDAFEPSRFLIRVWDGVEHCRPKGSYSMCPILGAEKLVIEEPETVIVEETAEEVHTDSEITELIQLLEDAKAEKDIMLMAGSTAEGELIEVEQEIVDYETRLDALLVATNEK